MAGAIGNCTLVRFRVHEWPLLAHGCRLAALHQVGSYLGYTGHQINIASRQTWPMRSIQSRLARPNSDIRGPWNSAPTTRQNLCADVLEPRSGRVAGSRPGPPSESAVAPGKVKRSKLYSQAS